MKLTLENKILGGFGLTIGLLAVLAVVAVNSIQRLTDDADLTRHTHEVLAHIAQVMSTVTDVQSGQRGFTLIGDELYLEPYQSAVARIDTELRELRRLTSDNQSQQQRLDKLEPLVVRRLEFAKQVIEIRRTQGFDMAQQNIATGTGKAIHDAIRKLVDELNDEEHELLSQRERRAHAAVRESLVVIGLGVVFTLSVIGAALVIVRRGFGALQRAEQALRQSHDELETRVRERTTEFAAINTSLREEIEHRLQAEARLESDQEVLEQVATSRPLADILETLTRNIESQLDSTMCSILLLDADGQHLRHGAAPSLPEAYNRAIDGGAIGPVAGSCGTAAFLRKQVIVSDIANDPLWAAFSELALGHGLRACWSTPIQCSKGRVLGTFAMYARTPRSPTRHELTITDRATAMASIAIERKQAEEALLRSHEDLEIKVVERTKELEAATERAQAADRIKSAILANAAHAIISTSPEGLITTFNPAAERLLGYSSADVLGIHTPAIIHDLAEVVARAAEFSTDLGETIAPGFEVFVAKARRNLPNENEWTYIRKDGTRFPVLLSVTALRDDANCITGFLGLAVDITDRKRAEAELVAAKERAESADRIKSSFLATMSHELRTPLNSIIGFTGIILQGLAGPLNAEQQKQLEMVRGSSRHLLSLINDVLDISKIEAGQLDVVREPFDLPKSLAKVLATVAPLAEKKGLTLRTNLAPELGLVVSDQRRVEQVLLNLLNNAIKFTEQGEVSLTVTLNPQLSTLNFGVTDTGIGIRAEDLATLFQPFRQIDSRLGRVHEGTGLGLAICRKLTELLGAPSTPQVSGKRGARFHSRCRWGSPNDSHIHKPTMEFRRAVSSDYLSKSSASTSGTSASAARYCSWLP